ncbi:helix-turn-helix transcriptional regulator [Maricaulis parjimensis]|uniref:helix-turn-helix transcriptional regulator n=1 Tax=Maricaulis parjimensis TaxID=144023 RepID=UPI00193A3D30|nr:LuxR C-terminal-related transcriptional regulator [Maricaulis parjimensis]
MTRSGWITITGFALVLAVSVFLLEWLEYRLWSRRMGVEVFAGLLAVGFAGLGIWLGFHLTRRAPATPFIRNEAALSSLGITPRELTVLEALVSGGSNKTIAESLGVSANTVKTHTARLYNKLGVSGRIEAIEQARLLRLIPASGSFEKTRPPDRGEHL